MTRYRELKLTIQGKIDGHDVTPMTLPMSRLADYLREFSKLLGHREHVHLKEIADGSAAPVAWVEEEKEARVRERVRLAAIGRGPEDANRAYVQLNDEFARDDWSGKLSEKIDNYEAKLIEFPGRRKEIHPVYGPIKETASVQGELKRVGGEEPTIPVWVTDADGELLCCETSKPMAKDLAHLLFQEVRLNGIATYVRDENAKWQMLNFLIQSYEPLSSESIVSVISDLRNIPGNEWSTMADPLAELRRLRHGEE